MAPTRPTRTGYVVLLVVAVIAIALVLFLRQRGARPKFPVIYDVANVLDEAQLGQVQAAVRAKGEKYLISVAAVSAERAQVTVGDGGFEPRSGRLYKLKRGAAGWEVYEVESWKNAS